MAAVMLAWGEPGARKLAAVAEVVVVVDVLRFTSIVTLATARGISVQPRADADGALLCPDALDDVADGEHVTIGSVNGAAISAALHDVSARVLAGSLLNAAAVADAVCAADVVALVPCGEHGADGLLRPSFEDLLGAGAVASRLGRPGNAAVDAARRAFDTRAGDDLADVLLGTISGRELEARDHGNDVCRVASIDSVPVVPRLVDGVFRA